MNLVQQMNGMTEIDKLDDAQLSAEIGRLHADPATGEGSNEAHLVHELQIHQVELEMQNRELRSAQLRLKEALDRYADLYDFAPVGYLSLDEKGCILEINLTGATLLGRERSTLAGKFFISCLADDDRHLFLGYLRQVFLSSCNVAAEVRIKTPSGLLSHVRLESKAVESAAKQRVCRTVMTDLSERKRADEASCLTARVIECAAEAILIADANKIIRSVNHAFEVATGYSANEVIGRTPALLKSGRHGEAFYREMWATLNKTGKWQGEVSNRRKDGEIYSGRLSISAVKDSSQRITHYVGIFADTHSAQQTEPA